MNTKFYINLFKALSHPIRFNIVVGLLKKAECNVQTMSDKLNLSQPIVSQHLAILRKFDIVKTNRRGNKVCYCIDDKRISNLIKSLK